MIIRSREDLAGDMPSAEMISSVLAEHSLSLPRLERLRRCYLADSDILRRTRDSGMPNNRIAHPFARYIASITTGYLIGQPVVYTCDDAQADALAAVMDTYDLCDVPSVDLENARHAAVFGRAVEYVHVDDRPGKPALPHITALDPRSAFVVYDTSYDMSALFGIYIVRRIAANGKDNGIRVWVAGPKVVEIYDASSSTPDAADLKVVDIQENFFGGVPMVEYWNDDDERGDFEWVIPIIDAYDKLQSDRVNDKEQFVNALLVLTGCTMENDERGRSPLRQLREDKMLSLPDINAKAEYLQGALTEADVEVLRSSLETDIHKLSMVPNMSDKDFAANASGVAMRYKLLGLEQLTSIKEQWFKEGLRARLRLIAHFMFVRGAPELDAEQVRITLTRALPANLLELAEIVQTAHNAQAASLKTRVAMLHQADGWTNEQIEEEAKQLALEQGTDIEDPLQIRDPALGDMEREREDEDA